MKRWAREHPEYIDEEIRGQLYVLGFVNSGLKVIEIANGGRMLTDKLLHQGIHIFKRHIWKAAHEIRASAHVRIHVLRVRTD